jgi:hypothetical protein
MQNLYKGGQVVTPTGNLEYTYPLFDTFWNNTGLRGTVFPLREFPGDNADALKDFEALVNNTSSLIYNFIYVK